MIGRHTVVDFDLVASVFWPELWEKSVAIGRNVATAKEVPLIADSPKRWRE